MELRHLRYFIAVADAGSLTVAAEQKLHTSQPSLSRQIRDLEAEVGVQLMHRSAHGIELTSAGKAFLDHARTAVLQAEAAKEAAQRSAELAKPTFALGFMSGAEIGLLPRINSVLSDAFPGIEIRLSSDYSPALAKALMQGQARSCFHAAGRAHGRSGLQARADGSTGFRASERSPPCIASGHRAAGDRRRSFHASLQDGPCGAPCVLDYFAGPVSS